MPSPNEENEEKYQEEMDFESPPLPDSGFHHYLPGLGPHNDRGFDIFACPHPRFRELDFCRPKSGSSTITIKDVDCHIEDMMSKDKGSKTSKEKEAETIEEFSLKEADEDMTNEKEEDHAENEDKEDEEDDMGDLSSLEIFKKVEKPTFEASKEKLDSLDEEEEASSGKGSVAEVEKPGPKSSYTPQIETEVSEVKNAEVKFRLNLVTILQAMSVTKALGTLNLVSARGLDNGPAGALKLANQVKVENI